MTYVIVVLAFSAMAGARPAAQTLTETGGQTAPPAAQSSEAQRPTPASAPAAIPLAPVPLLAAAAPAPLSAALIERRSEAVRAMEVILAQKVRDSADRIARRMQEIDPGTILLTGSLRARGFILEGYGVFFYVEVPPVRPSVAWIVRNLEQRNRQNASPPAGPQRTSDTVVAADSFLDNPDLHYVETVKTALINAMLEYGKPMELQSYEWFTVAASDSGGPMVPNEVYNAPTMMLRVKGSDVADYLAGRLTLEEARKKVELRKF